MGAAPTYAATPRPIDKVFINTANTNRDGSGTISLLALGSTNGFKVQEIAAQALETTTAGMIRVFHSLDGGTTWTMIDELPVGATTASASAPAFRAAHNYQNLVLITTSEAIGVSTHAAEDFEVYAFGADL